MCPLQRERKKERGRGRGREREKLRGERERECGGLMFSALHNRCLCLLPSLPPSSLSLLPSFISFQFPPPFFSWWARCRSLSRRLTSGVAGISLKSGLPLWKMKKKTTKIFFTLTEEVKKVMEHNYAVEMVCISLKFQGWDSNVWNLIVHCLQQENVVLFMYKPFYLLLKPTL